MSAELAEARLRSFEGRTGHMREYLGSVPPSVEPSEWMELLMPPATVEWDSAYLGEAVVTHLCFSHNQPSLWKFLDHSLSSGSISPLHVLSLLTSRIIPHRRSEPQAYQLYLQLLSHYALTFKSLAADSCNPKILESVDAALQLSQANGIIVKEIEHAFVLFFFSIIVALVDCTLDDCGLQMSSVNQKSGSARNTDICKMDIDYVANSSSEKTEQCKTMRAKNSFTAVEVLSKLTGSRKAKLLLRLVYLNMPQRFDGLLQRLQFLEAKKSTAANLKSASQLLANISANIFDVLSFDYQLNNRKLIGTLIDNRPCGLLSHCDSGSVRSACWVSFDVYMENAMDGKHLPVRSAVAILAETIYTLKVINRASWRETFLELWISALRLVQREREPLEGPIPHLEARLCVLLSIVPLAIAIVLKDDFKVPSSSGHESMMSGFGETGYGIRLLEKEHASRMHALVSSLQLLGNFSGLLSPPMSIVDVANTAQSKAANFISKSKNTMDGSSGASSNCSLPAAGGSMRHLIVEACIARNLIDSSAYFWPGYLSTSTPVTSDLSSIHSSPWLTFMDGGPLSGPLIDLLFKTPASSLMEIEKLYHIALSGSAEEKAASAKILCGASLSHGWNIQEHVVRFIVKLLSPPVPPSYNGQGSHLVDYMPMLSAILLGVSSVDSVHILSLHGVIPEVAAALLQLCEVFGSLAPTSTNKLVTGDDEPSVYLVFSTAFLFLLRLWKFYRPPVERCINGGSLRADLSLEYLLLLRNNRVASNTSSIADGNNDNTDRLECASDKPVYIDCFPKLRAWYSQNRTCLASTLSGLGSESPVYRVADNILNMIYHKISKNGACSGNSSAPSSGSIGGSAASTGEDAQQRPVFTAWEVLEAIPFVLEATLTACAHGRLSSRDLTTGLRDLIDFLPASLAAIITYFSAEVTRGIWKHVPMNGIDWPSPAAILPSVESEMKQVLAAVGVTTPICSSGDSQAMLPLPIAALVSLTITFKLTKRLEYIHAVAGPALEDCASGCAWPSIPIISSLWVQKVRRWHDFIVVSSSRSVFRQSKEAVAQLLRSCFTSFLGSSSSSTDSATPLMNKQNSVQGLLGSLVTAPWKRPFLAPGFLYLRSCRTIRNIQHVNNVILQLVVEHSRDSATKWANADSPRLKSSQASLPLAIDKAREIATLGASLLSVTGGLQLVQELYRETIPTWLLSSREENTQEPISAVARVMEGYVLAYLLVLSGGLVWGIGGKPPSYVVSRTRKSRILGVHMDFLASVLEGNVSLGCHPATWNAYVSCVVGLMVSCAPAWIQEVKAETLRTLAGGLRGWHECELALSLLEKGGIPTVASFVQMVNNVIP